MFQVKIAKYENSFDKYVVVDENMEVFEPVLLYSERLHATKKISTIYNYLTKITKFLNYLNEKNMTFDMVTEETIVKYINYLKGYEEENVIPIEQKLSGGTINLHLTVLAAFYQTLIDYKLFFETSPVSYCESFRPADMNRSFLYHASINKRTTKKHKLKTNVKRGNNLNVSRTRKSEEEIDIYRSFIEDERDLLIFDILYNTGMRISECLNLTLFDYSEPGIDGWGTIRVVERDLEDFKDIKQAESRQIKTGSREIAVSNDLIERLDKYITEKREYVPNEEFIFVSEKGIKGEPLCRGTVEYHFRKASEASGIKITPHDLRHTHITELTEAGFDNLYIRLRVGHSSPNTTMKYQHPSLESQADAYMRFYENKRL